MSVGVDHDTPVFAATSIEAWWEQIGEKCYPAAREPFITADAGGSNSYRSHVWKHRLQMLADKLGVAFHGNWNYAINPRAQLRRPVDSLFRGP